MFFPPVPLTSSPACCRCPARRGRGPGRRRPSWRCSSAPGSSGCCWSSGRRTGPGRRRPSDRSSRRCPRREGVWRSADEECFGLLVFLVVVTSLQLLQQTAGMRHGVPEVFHPPVPHGVQTHAQGRQSGGAPPQHRAQLLEDRRRQLAPLQAAERERLSGERGRSLERGVWTGPT